MEDPRVQRPLNESRRGLVPERSCRDLRKRQEELVCMCATGAAKKNRPIWRIQ